MKIGQWAPIVCFKHDGSVHRSWNKTLLIYEDKDCFVMGNDNALVYESDGRNWRVREPAITIFFKKKWFNVIAMLREEGIKYYVNIASPFVICDQTICYIDYDLDVSLKPDIPLRILDEHEYYSHLKDMGYSPKLNYLIKDALYEVVRKAKDEQFPFVDKKIYELYDKFKELKLKEGANNEI